MGSCLVVWYRECERQQRRDGGVSSGLGDVLTKATFLGPGEVLLSVQISSPWEGQSVPPQPVGLQDDKASKILNKET